MWIVDRSLLGVRISIDIIGDHDAGMEKGRWKITKEERGCERCSHFEEDRDTGPFVCTETKKKVVELTEAN